MTVNSTGGLDSLLLGKPVHILGKSYYQDLYGVIDEKDLKPYLEGKLNLERELVIKEAQSLFRRILYQLILEVGISNTFQNLIIF